MLKTALGWLRVVAFLEGMSFLILLGIAMPLKYFAANPEPVRIIGMAHGVLFVAYVFLVLQAMFVYKWKISKGILAFIASLIPFGTFYADKKLFREE